MKILLLFTIFSHFSHSYVLFENKQSSEPKSQEIKVIRKPAKKRSYKKKGNLPNYALAKKREDFEIQDVATITKNPFNELMVIKPGEKYNLSLSGIIYAIEGTEVEVTGTIMDGPLIGSIVKGKSQLNTTNKKITVNFDTIYDTDGSEYKFEARGLSSNNMYFDPLKYISNKNKKIAASGAAAFASSLLESKVQTAQNLLGTNSPNNSLKNSLYLAGRDSFRSVSSEFLNAYKISKDFAYFKSKQIFTLEILTRPKSN